MTESNPRLRMRSVTKRFGATVALAGVDLEVHAGEVHALIGENGAGKSTLMKVLSGALAPDEGELWLDERSYSPTGPFDGRRAGVAMIYQELSLAPHLSVAENVMLGVEPTRWGVLDRREMRAKTRAALAELGHEDIDVTAPVASLRPALRQLVEIARAIAGECKVVVLDEPTSSLGHDDVQLVFSLMRRLRERGLAIVYISHFLDEVTTIADRFTVLRDGQSVSSGNIAAVTSDDLVRAMIGRQVDELYPRSERRRGELLLEIDGLAGERRPASVTLRLHRGEVLGVAGLVGAGRTELLRCVFGLDAVREGSVRVAGGGGDFADLGRTPRESWARGVGIVSEDRKDEGLATSLSIADNLTLSRLEGLGSFGWVWSSRQRAAAVPWIERLSIRCRAPEQTVGELSGGNQQKVAFARLLHHDVDVLLLDEPTRGIDVGSKAQIYRWIDALASGRDGRGRAVLLVSSSFAELLGVCDAIAVMRRGELGELRPVERWSERELLAEAVGGVEA